jgi:hypothetical protein
MSSPRFSSGRRPNGFDDEDVHYPTRPVDKDKAEHELVVNIKKATSSEESAPKQKHVRSMSIVYSIAVLRLIAYRVHRIHLGLPFLDIILEWSSGATHLGRRSSDFQGAHYSP